MKKEIIIATTNPGKTREFKAYFPESDYIIKTMADFPELEDVEETGVTFEENARLKAETIAAILQKPVLADDSGLCVYALNKAPGVYSARYAGEPRNDEANNKKLLRAMKDEKVTLAYYQTVLALATPGEESIVSEGKVFGYILPEPRGTNGFAYDPYFLLKDDDRTMAELTTEEKNAFSHRGKALVQMLALMEAKQKEKEQEGNKDETGE